MHSELSGILPGGALPKKLCLSIPISFMISSPVYSAPGYKRCPIFAKANVTVRSAQKAVPSTLPVSALMPDEMSRAILYALI